MIFMAATIFIIVVVIHFIENLVAVPLSFIIVIVIWAYHCHIFYNNFYWKPFCGPCGAPSGPWWWGPQQMDTQQPGTIGFKSKIELNRMMMMIVTMMITMIMMIMMMILPLPACSARWAGRWSSVLSSPELPLQCPHLRILYLYFVSHFVFVFCIFCICVTFVFVFCVSQTLVAFAMSSPGDFVFVFFLSFVYFEQLCFCISFSILSTNLVKYPVNCICQGAMWLLVLTLVGLVLVVFLITIMCWLCCWW